MNYFFSIIRFAVVALFLGLMVSTSVVFAAPLNKDVKPQTIPCVPNLPCIQQETQTKGKNVREYITGTFGTTFMKVFLGLTAASSVIFIIVGGLQMHLAFGNEEGINKAKKTLTWAIVGLIISILSVAIVQIISKLPIKNL